MHALLLVAALLCADDKPAIRTASTAFVVFPQDANANPPMAFGGKLLSEMDRCAGITARRFLWSSPTGARDAVTLAINNVVFHQSAQVKDLLIVEGNVVKVGEKSITIRVHVLRETADGQSRLVSGTFIFVAYDLAAKKAIPHGLATEGK